MRDRGPWRLWSLLLLLTAGNLKSLFVQCQYNEGGARGDEGSPASLGFSGVELRHDGYVKGETPTIPQTSFSCSAQPYNPGLYADTETQCQVYHVCFEDRQESFLCGPGTNFNQRILACDFWYNFDCQESPSFYSVNADIGKVPDSVFNAGQGGRQPSPQQPSYPRVPQQPPSVGSNVPRVTAPPPRVQPQPERPSYPSFPQQPPSQGSIPNRESVPPPPQRIQPEFPRVQTQPPRIEPQIPRIQPQPPRIEPQIPRIQPQPPRIEPQIPRIQPQPPRFQPQPPSIPSQPPIPEFRPQPPPAFVQPQYPRISQPGGQPSKVRPPPVQQLTPSIQQEEDTGYQFGGNNRQKPISLPPPQQVRPQTSRPVFPPVVSPPRVSRPPLTPPVIRQPEIAISRPRVPIAVGRPEFHPDSHLKGNVDYRPAQQPRLPQPSRPVGTGYPSYPVSQVPAAQNPIEKPSRRPSYQPPITLQQEHVDTEYVPPPPPPPVRQPSRPTTEYIPRQPPPKQPSKPTTVYVPPPPPPPPVQQEIAHIPPPQPPSRPAYVPPPSPAFQKPVDTGYGRQPAVEKKPIESGHGKQPPVSPSIIREQQKPAISPPSRPQVSVGVRQPQQPQRPKPVFPPPSDHPNSNIKGGPGYNQPPPQVPRFEPTRISRPSIPQGGYQEPPKQVRPPADVEKLSVKPTIEKRPTATGSGGYKPPTQGRIKTPSEPPRSVYQPPIQVIDHPRSEIKGTGYEGPIAPQQPQRIESQSSPISGVKRPQTGGGYQEPQKQRPRAPIVVARPQPPSLPRTSVKQPVAPPSRMKLPSQTQVQSVSSGQAFRPSQPDVPSHGAFDHPNANVKGGGGYNQVRPQPVQITRRPSNPPSLPSTSYEQKTPSGCGRQGGGCRPRGDGGYSQQRIPQQDYKPQRSRTKTAHSIKTPQEFSGVKDVGTYQRPPTVSSHSSIVPKQVKPDYDSGSSYTRGPDIYPKPEFGQSNGPHPPVSVPSRANHGIKEGPAPQNSIAENKPTYQGLPASSGSGTAVRPEYPFREVPGHQPPHQPQVFPYRENPDHPNESLKGSAAYRPPPPAGYQAAASEVQEQKVAAEAKPDTSSPLLGDVGVE
ncbi:uncharacterized protein LOC129221652 [Uloborus diversus]|uniref:uncharacterized protein LOC129221652 n=1 Tax=Uloborus diversus TaxID=327109 RepID=UPI002409969F|nr:uncharacterized protein LOC129221652 [Uloborus diversus]XP_054712155.1 uncharacterized protein LOC129221652 [Uloborus diversus]